MSSHEASSLGLLVVRGINEFDRVHQLEAEKEYISVLLLPGVSVVVVVVVKCEILLLLHYRRLLCASQ